MFGFPQFDYIWSNIGTYSNQVEMIETKPLFRP